MPTTYAQKQAPAQKKDANSTASVVDCSSQGESLQRKADMANGTVQRVVKCSSNFYKNHTLADENYEYFKAHRNDVNKDNRYRNIVKNLADRRTRRRVIANSVVPKSSVVKDTSVVGFGTESFSVSESIKTDSSGKSTLISGSGNSDNRVNGKTNGADKEYTHFHGSNPG